MSTAQHGSAGERPSSACHSLPSQTDAIAKFKFEGEISSEFAFPKVDINQITHIVLEVGEVKFINSGGVQNWVVWSSRISDKAPQMKFELLRLPCVLSRKIFSLGSFMCKNAVVRSLFVPYYCDRCDLEKETLFEVKLDLQDKILNHEELKSLTPTPCTQCGSPMEMDMDLANCLRLITGQS